MFSRSYFLIDPILEVIAIIILLLNEKIKPRCMALYRHTARLVFYNSGF